jgi:tricarboxylate carrier
VPLLETAVACSAGLFIVTGGTFAIEQYTAPSCPEFNPEKTRFDQSSFAGRFCTMILKCDPKLITYSEEECFKQKKMVENYKALLADPPASAANNIHHTLWEAQRISSSAIHPDTGDVIPRPFRMSGFLPYNGPISVAMVASGSTPVLLFWNWVNQSQNAMVNYCNRNASTELPNETLAKSYAAAVGSALIVAFGLATFVKKRYAPDQARKLLRFVAFPSAVVASSLNCYIVRSPEIGTGIPLMNDRNEEVLSGETSVVAAKCGVYSTTASRAMLQAPVFFFPPMLLSSVPMFQKICARNPAMATPITTFLLLVSFGLGLPATVAIFPQISEIKVGDLEEKYQHLVDQKTGKTYETLYYNKGL